MLENGSDKIELLYSLLKRQLPSSSSFLHRLKSTNTFKHLLGFPLSWDPFLKKRTEKIKTFSNEQTKM